MFHRELPSDEWTLTGDGTSDGELLVVHANSPLRAKEWTFNKVIAPLSFPRFRDTVWAKRPLHVVRSEPNYYRELVTLNDVERCLSLPDVFLRQSISTPRRGSGVPDLPPRSMAELYHRLSIGLSVRIRHLENFLDPEAPLLALYRSMEMTLQHPKASLSCYISPGTSDGLGPHSDESEIFTLQVSGAKRWRIFGKASLANPHIFHPDEVGEPECEIVLHPGDLLYVPRGRIHWVDSVSESSFSVAMVFTPFTWRTLFSAVAELAANDARFDEALPVGALLDGIDREFMNGTFKEFTKVAQDCLSMMTAHDLADYLGKRLVAQSTLPPAAQLEKVIDIKSVTGETVVTRRTGLMCYLTAAGGTCILTLPGGSQISEDIRAIETLADLIVRNESTPVDQMYGALTLAEKIDLARKLIVAGMLIVVS
jgi:hypothetical protein